MFNHMGVDLPTHSLSRIQENGKRFYLTPDGGKYPSITTVLGWFSRKGIMEWRKRVGEAEANKISTQASRSGTNVHQMAEAYGVPVILHTDHAARKISRRSKTGFLVYMSDMAIWGI